MLCKPCSRQEHEDCTNPPTCTCLHRKAVKLEDGTIAPIREDGIVRRLAPGQEG